MNDIIGISAYYHDSSVALVRDGKLKVFIKEESLTRIKGASGFPVQSLTYLLNKYGINENTIGKVCFYEKPLRGWLKLTKHALDKPIQRWRQAANQLRSFWDGPIFFAEELKKLINIKPEKIIYCEHHLSHALTGLAFAENILPWTVFVIDGVGDGETATIFDVRSKKFDRIWTAEFPHSVGLFYSAITDFLGFAVNDGEYKVMALAAFGEPIYADFMKENLIKFENCSLNSDLTFYDFHRTPERSYSNKLIDVLGPPAIELESPYDKNNTEFKRLADIAASAQAVTVSTVEEIVRFGLKFTGSKNVILSGGVAQNCRAAAEISRLDEIDKFLIPPSPGDSGAAIGAAYYAFLISGGCNFPRPEISPGPKPKIPKVMPKLFSFCVGSADMLTKVAELIKRGEILATFIGSAETGPRALGNRSLLCNGSNIASVTELNRGIKKREDFRPLAPIMRAETAPKYFRLNSKALETYSWMGITAEALENTIESHPAILHVDRTARLQIVYPEQKLLWKLLSICEQNGMPILVNTSFNIAGDPIVFDYIDCYVNMYRMGLTWLLSDEGIYKLKDV